MREAGPDQENEEEEEEEDFYSLPPMPEVTMPPPMGPGSPRGASSASFPDDESLERIRKIPLSRVKGNSFPRAYGKMVYGKCKRVVEDMIRLYDEWGQHELYKKVVRKSRNLDFGVCFSSEHMMAVHSHLENSKSFNINSLMLHHKKYVEAFGFYKSEEVKMLYNKDLSYAMLGLISDDVSFTVKEINVKQYYRVKQNNIDV